MNTAPLQPEEECCHLEEEKLALSKRLREASGADASLFGGKMVVVLKLPKLGLVPCVFRAQSHDYSNIFFNELVFHFVAWLVSADSFNLKSSVHQTLTVPTRCCPFSPYYVPEPGDIVVIYNA